MATKTITLKDEMCIVKTSRGTVNAIDVLSTLCATGLFVFWFIQRHAVYAWILQDLFGICYCFVFLQGVHCSTIRIATFLLVLLFVYDIFFVFLTPLIFEKSVMIVAAKGGKQAETSAPFGFCLRYPQNTQHACRKESLPILPRLPRIAGWKGDDVMLGLGDIFFPGLLLTFCARYDYLTRGNLWGTPPPAHERVHPTAIASPGSIGYFLSLCIGYAVGLFAAIVAVVLMERGQPALLYLVPTTLGTLLVLGYWHGSLNQLWNGIKETSELPLESEVNVHEFART